MTSPYQPLFLHFINRELMWIRGKKWTHAEIGRFIRLSALMTAGRLNAPFGQAHELLHSTPDLVRLVTSLVHSGRLDLAGPSADVWAFLEGRQELYSSNRPAYENYYDKRHKRTLNDVYTHSKLLRTTHHIKQQLALLATVGPGSNIFSAEESAFVKTQREFVTGELIDKPIGATFSIYLKQPIEPQPDVSHRLGNLSSRAFANHYQDIHATVSPTGLYRDTLVESYDYFPHYDVDLNFFLLSALGMDEIVTRPDYERFFHTISQDKNLYRFVEMKDNLFSSIVGKLRHANSIFSPNQDHIKGELRKFSFAGTGAGGFVADPTLFAEKIRNAIASRSDADRVYADSLAEGVVAKVSRVRIAIFTATDLEDAVLRAQLSQFSFLPAGRITGPDGYYNVYSMYDRVHVIHVRSGMGTTGVHGSQRVAHDFLATVEVEMAVAVGICFGVDSAKQSLGDVVVAEQFTLYEPAKIKNGVMEFRGDKVPAETRLVSYGHAASADALGHRIFVGPVLTGDKLVDDLTFRQTILAANGKAIGGEMEAGGLATSCFAKQVRFGMAKGICDFADKKSDDVQEEAASNAVRLVLGFIKHTWGEKSE